VSLAKIKVILAKFPLARPAASTYISAMQSQVKIYTSDSISAVSIFTGTILFPASSRNHKTIIYMFYTSCTVEVLTIAAAGGDLQLRLIRKRPRRGQDFCFMMNEYVGGRSIP
jgi:hypothetical protein